MYILGTAALMLVYILHVATITYYNMVTRDMIELYIRASGECVYFSNVAN